MIRTVYTRAAAICAVVMLSASSVLAAAPAAGKAGAKGGVATTQPSAPVAAPRASWLNDRKLLHPGDLVTVVVDERTQANETESHVANNDHDTRADLDADINDTNVRLGPSKSLSAGLNLDSRHQGTAGRTGDLSAVMTVTVVSINSAGIANIHGERQVTIDGRLQNIALNGLLRAQDVGPDNVALSSRIANAQVTLNGKRINPRVGIVSNMLGLVWP